VRISVPERAGPDPHRRSHHADAERDSESYAKPHSKRGQDDGRSDRRTDNAGTDPAADEYTGADGGPDEDALGPAQLRDDRRELAHRIAGHRDVADAEALTALQQELAQRCARAVQHERAAYQAVRRAAQMSAQSSHERPSAIGHCGVEHEHVELDAFDPLARDRA